MNVFGKFFEKSPQITEEERLKREALLRAFPEEKILESGEVIESIPLKGGRREVLFIDLRDDGSAIFKFDKAAEIGGLKENQSCSRERAAYLVSRFLDLDLVPPTVIREMSGGIGNVQQFIPNTQSAMFITPEKRESGYRKELMKLWLFDLVIWNTDRHDGNYLFTQDKVYAIDNEFSFWSKAEVPFIQGIGPEESYFNIPITQEIKNKFEKFFVWKEGQKVLRNQLNKLLGKEKADDCLARIEQIGKALREKGMISRPEIKGYVGY